MKISLKNLLMYIATCLTGSFMIFILSALFHYSNIGWCLVSIMLVISPDSKEAIHLAFSRIKANLTGGAAGFLCLAIGAPEVVTVSLSIALTISLCYAFNVMASSRSALAAVIIVLLHEGGTHLWDIALERVLSVIAGCLLGLLVTFLFHRRWKETGEPGDTEDDG